MVQYLDKAGLTYLWRQLKSKFLAGNTGGVFYGTCSTAAGTVAKVVECANFTADNLKAGAIIIVTFTATNSGAVANLTMNVNGTGAKHIKYINNGTLGNLSSAGYLKANTEYPFYYDGTNWVCWFNVNSPLIYYPVGSYYETSDTSFDPNTAWGGTWVLEAEGQVHVSAGENYVVSGALTDTTDGGDKDAIIPYHNHSTSITQPTFTIPNHTHKGYYRKDNTVGGHSDRLGHSGAYSGADIVTTTSSGGGGACNRTTNVAVTVNYAGTSGNATDANMQPYIVVNRWHRTA